MTTIHRNSTPARPARKLLSCALASCLMLAAPAFAQSTAATIRGQVMADSAPATQARVTATNVATGLSRTVQAGDNGAYSVSGLPPGTYRLDVDAGGRYSSQTITVQVGQTAVLNLGVTEGSAGKTTTLGTVQVTAQSVVESRTSEVATYVTQKQIEALPQSTRNFLAFADTVPGMEFTENPDDGSTKLTGGVQSANNINVYIDGVGQKNYVLKGGITGQDSSRGNPFPQLAIGEYKVITSNYKAEYDQISSAAVTAVTRSGGNEFHGSFFWDYSNTDMREAKESEQGEGNSKARSKDEQYGFSLGGPIVKDVAHFFITYEGKDYQSPKDISPGQGYSVSDLPSWLQSQVGSDSVPFHEDLYFGKIDWSIDENNLIELTFKSRSETSISNVGDQQTSSYGTDSRVDERRADLRWQLTLGDWLNDAHLTYEDSYWFMEPETFGNGYVLTDGDSNTGDVILASGGGSGGYQRKGQDGWSFQNDLTFSGWERHTVKMGVKYKQVELETTEQQPYNSQYYYDIADTSTPYYLTFTTGVAGTSQGTVNSSNKQFGIYLQDDWEATDKLTLNLGLRWDYEETPAFLDFVTDPDVVAAIYSQDTQSGAATGQTYADTLAKGGIDISKFISTGSNRHAFKDAWQPRVGFSYDLFDDERHVIFGGAGRSYDRTLFDYLQLEQTKATYPSYSFRINTAEHPCDSSTDSTCLEWSDSLYDKSELESLVSGTTTGQEVWMFSNDLRPPHSDQFSIGIRNAFDMLGYQWNSSATLQRIQYRDGLLLVLGNRHADGSYYDDSGSPWSGSGIPGYGSLILGINGFESNANSLLLSLEKPYTKTSPWSINVAYTFTDAEQNVHEEDAEYGWYYVDGGWYGGAYTPRHRLVISGMVDGPWGLGFSGKLRLATPIRRWTTDSNNVIRSFTPDGTLGFKQFDVSASKVWDTGSAIKLKARFDIMNLFNWTNWSNYYMDFGTGTMTHSGQYQTRTFKLSFGLDW